MNSSKTSNRQDEKQPKKQQPKDAKQRAVGLIARRDYTVFEITQKLTRDGYGNEVVKDAITHLKASGLLDDDRYTRLYCESRLRAGYGPYRIASKLLLKGIAEDRTREVLDRIMAEEEFDLFESARVIASRFCLDDPKERQRALRRLMSRGFDYGTAKQAIEAERK